MVQKTLFLLLIFHEIADNVHKSFFRNLLHCAGFFFKEKDARRFVEVALDEFQIQFRKSLERGDVAALLYKYRNQEDDTGIESNPLDQERGKLFPWLSIISGVLLSHGRIS